MHLYFIIPMLCIGVSLGLWIYYSVESPRKLLILIGSVLLVGVLGYFTVPPLIAWGDRWMKEASTVALEPFVGGSINSVTVGGRPLSTFSNGIQVRQGDRMDLTGWIQSSLGNGTSPEILLCSTNQEVGEISFTTSIVPRPDVVQHENNPALMQSGFSSSIQISKTQTLGVHYLKILKRDNSQSQTYLPGMAINVTYKGSSLKETTTNKKSPKK